VLRKKDEDMDSRASEYALADSVAASLEEGGIVSNAVVHYVQLAPDQFYKEVIRQGEGSRSAAVLLTYRTVANAALKPPTVQAVKTFLSDCRFDRALERPAAEVLHQAIALVEPARPHITIPVPTDQTASPSAPSHASGSPAPLYASLAVFRPHVNQRTKRAITLPTVTQADCLRVLDDKNAQWQPSIQRGQGLPTHKDYIEQLPIEVTKNLFDQQLRVLQTYYQDYVTNPVVANATKFFVKLIMDAYVQRLPLLANYTYLREVSYSFLPAFRSLVGGDYFNVKKHVYTLLATLASHAQLLDRSDSFAGATRAVEEEVGWLLRRVLEFHVLTVEPDDRLLIAALKCCFVVLPSQAEWRLIHPGALRAMMSIPSVGSCYPKAFDALAAALAKQLETLALGSNNQKLENALLHIGGDVGLVEMLANAPTVSAAVSLVRAIAASHNLIPTPSETSLAAERAWHVLESLKVSWCLHLLAAQPPGSISQAALAKELTSSVISDAEREHDVKQQLSILLPQLVEIVAEAHHLPPLIRRANSADIAEAVQSMLVDACDPELRRVGVRVLAHALRADWVEQASNRANSSAPTASPAPPGTKTINEVAHDVATSMLPKLQAASAVLLRRCARVLTAALPLTTKTNFLLLAKDAVDPARPAQPPSVLLSLYRGLLESITVIARVDDLHGDASDMLLHGATTAWTSIVESGLDVTLAGETHGLLWCLYWALRRADSSTASVRTARHVLLALSCTNERAAQLQWAGKSGVTLWHEVMQDPHAPCAMLGAQQFIHVAAVAHYDRYEAAVGDVAREPNSALRNPYYLARTIYSRIHES
jgi:hypothetical protein